jgi:hypothetical protein
MNRSIVWGGVDVAREPLCPGRLFQADHER